MTYSMVHLVRRDTVVTGSSRQLTSIHDQERAHPVTSTQFSPTTVSMEQAERAVEAAKMKAAQIGLPFTVTVVDAGTHLVSATRMDGAILGSIEVSATKARTAVLFGQQTKDLNAAVQPGTTMFSIEQAIREPVTFVAGGIPLVDDRGLVIGAVGVSGGTPDQDHEVALAAAGLGV